MTYEQIIQKAGRRIIPRIFYYENGTEISLNRDDFQQAKFKFNASLVGTVMYGVELETKVLLPNTEIFIEITAKYETYTQKKVYGGYLRRNEPTYNADAKTYTYEMYDKIITAMVDYEPISITYPTTIYNYFNKLITELGFTTDIVSLPNGKQTIEKDIYKGINYTYRDVLNDIGQATGTLFIIENNIIKKCDFGTSEITIDDNILKNQNITLGKHFGPINTIVLTRSGESDSVYYPQELPENPIEFRIADNQLMNDNNRADYLAEIYNQLNGIEFDVYDTALVGYGGFAPLEKIKISTNGKEYNSYVFNNEITISQGYEEVIYTEMPVETKTDYKHASKDDRMINQVYIIAKKNEAEILAVVNTTKELQKEINPTKNESGSNIYIEDASDSPLIQLEIEGKSIQDGTPAPDTPVEIESVGYENLFDKNLEYIKRANSTSVSIKDDNIIVSNSNTAGNGGIAYFIDVGNNEQITISFDEILSTIDNANNTRIQYAFYDEPLTELSTTALGTYIPKNVGYVTVTSTARYLMLLLRVDNGSTGTFKNIIVSKGSTPHSFIPYGKYGVEVKTIGENILNNTKYELGGWNEGGVKTSATDIYRFNEPIEVIGGETLYFSKRLCLYFDVSGSDTTNNLVKVVPKNATKMYLRCFANDFSTFKPEDYMISRTQITELKSYKKNTSVIVLNEPLRNLPNGVKDIAYIKNNKLYVDRYVGSVVLNGSEEWGTFNTKCYYTNYSGVVYSSMFSNYFVRVVNVWDTSKNGIETLTYNGSPKLFIQMTSITNINEFKTWLSTNNVQVDYELATPITEELGEIEMLKTLKGYNNISTTDDLLPIINLTYVRDTQIANYVEEHMAQIKINEDNIRLEVGKKIDGEEVVSTINQSAEEIQLKGNRVVIESDNFELDKNGNMICNNATVTGGNIILNDSGNSNSAPKMKVQNSNNNSEYSVVGSKNIDMVGEDYAIMIRSILGMPRIIVADYSGTENVSSNITAHNISTPELIQTSRVEDKKNFELYDNALNEIKKIDIYKYNLKFEEDNDKKHLGFIIGKEYNYSSEITAIDEDGKEIGVDNYSMTSLCLQAIKEQQEIIEQLKKEISLLKEQK